MSPLWQGVLLTVGVLVVLVCIYHLVTLYVLMTMDTGGPISRWKDRRRQKRRAKESMVTVPLRVGQRLPDPEQVKEAMPIDPNNPPSWKVYMPSKDAPGRACACHPDIALIPGQKVLWWPVPHSGGGVNVFCQDGVEVDQ